MSRARPTEAFQEDEMGMCRVQPKHLCVLGAHHGIKRLQDLQTEIEGKK